MLSIVFLRISYSTFNSLASCEICLRISGNATATLRSFGSSAKAFAKRAAHNSCISSSSSKDVRQELILRLERKRRNSHYSLYVHQYFAKRTTQYFYGSAAMPGHYGIFGHLFCSELWHGQKALLRQRVTRPLRIVPTQIGNARRCYWAGRSAR